MSLGFLGEILPALLGGALTTLRLVAVALALGLLFALPLALARLSDHRPLAVFAQAYVFVFRSTPLLVQIFLIYYGLGQFDWVRTSVFWPFLREAWWCAILALSLNTAAYTSEIIRGGIRSVPYGQVEAARALGMSGLLLYRRVLFPLAARQALPAYGNEIIQMVQASSLASTITLLELTGVARALASKSFQPVEVFVAAGAIYLAINLALTRLVGRFETRWAPAGR